MTRPLVSVIVPFLDPPADFFSEAVASIEAQDYRPLELILVNDGSAQDAVELARRLADGVGLPARCLEHPGGVNRGCSATRNLGASAARGEYLAFLDADDVWIPSKLSEQVEILQSNPDLAMVFGLTRYWYSWRRGEDSPATDFIVDRGVRRPVTIRPPEFVPLFLRGKIIVPGPSNTMIRREAFSGCGGFEESFRGMYEDQAFLVKLGLEHSVAGVPRHWDNYRQHSTSMMALAYEQDAELHARITFLEWVRHCCASKGIRSPDVWEAVNKEAWLAGTAQADRHRPSRTAHRLKRWWLRLEERLFPAGLRHRIWSRRSMRGH
jgi:glycosyltransferase involved in cell wall biosynthesis